MERERERESNQERLEQAGVRETEREKSWRERTRHHGPVM